MIPKPVHAYWLICEDSCLWSIVDLKNNSYFWSTIPKGMDIDLDGI